MNIKNRKYFKQGEILITVEDFYQNKVTFYYDNVLTDDERDFITNVQSGEWTVLAILKNFENALYIAEKYYALTYYETLIHENNNTFIVAVKSNIDYINVESFKKTFTGLNFNKLNKRT